MSPPSAAAAPQGKEERHQDRADSPKRRPAAAVAVTKLPKPKYHLLLASKVPLWYAENPFLYTGYRPVTGSVKLCLDSWHHIHNETVNIYSHLIPAVLALFSNGLLYLYFRDRYPIASAKGQIAVHIYLTTSVLCFGISSMYHTLLCHSEGVSGLWARLDYFAITVQTIGSFISGLGVTFYCKPRLQWIYGTMVGHPLPPLHSSSCPLTKRRSSY